MAEDPMGAFSEAILNYHEHYQEVHTSEWYCKLKLLLLSIMIKEYHKHRL